MTTRITSILAAIATSQIALAGDPDAFQEPLAPAVEESDCWSYKLSIYGPIVDLSGTTRIGTNIVPVDLPFSDIFDNLDGGVVLAGEAQKGKFSIIGDFIWLKLSTSASANPASYAGLKLQQTIGNLAVGYQFYQSPKWTVDGLIGAAYTGLQIDSEITTIPPGPGGPTTRYLSADESWVDPFVGIRARCKISEKWRAFGRVEYGGFGVGSDNYFQAIVGGGYQFTECVGAYLAYRHLMVDYSKSAFAYDVETSGPQVGLVFIF